MWSSRAVARSIAEMRLQSGRVRRHEAAQEEANEPDLHRNCWPCGADRPDKISGGSKDAIFTSRSVGQAGITSACDASLPSSWGYGSCDGVDHPDDHGGPRFGSAEFVTDLPLPTFAFVLRAPTCASMCSYSVCWVWCSQPRSYWRSHRGR